MIKKINRIEWGRFHTEDQPGKRPNNPLSNSSRNKKSEQAAKPRAQANPSR